VAHAYWPQRSPVGLTLVEGSDPEPYTVVGIVKDVRWWAWDEDVASIYGPFEPLSHYPIFSVVIHASSSTGQVMARAIEALQSADFLRDLFTRRDAGRHVCRLNPAQNGFNPGCSDRLLRQRSRLWVSASSACSRCPLRAGQKRWVFVKRSAPRRWELSGCFYGSS
jgi:hypothetical protein